MAEERRTTGTAQGSVQAHALVERARRILLHEQRTGHEDAAVKPGGLEAFITRWADDVRAARAEGSFAGSSGQPPEDAILRLVAGYHALDPMRRTATVRSALALLDMLQASTSAASDPARSAPAPAPHPPTSGSPLRPERRAGRGGASDHREAQWPESEAWGQGSRSADGQVVRSAPSSARRRQPPAFGTRAQRPVPPVDAVEPWPLASEPPAPPVLGRPTGKPGTSNGHTTLTARPEDAYLLEAPVTAIPSVGATQASRLARLGVRTVHDLLFTFPREHRDYSKLQKIATLPFDEVCTVLGIIWEVENQRTKGGRVRTIARISDETGGLRVTWFNQPYLLKQLPRGAHIVVTGVKQRFGNRVEFSVRSHELPEQGDLINTGRLVPVYPLTEGLHPKAMRRFAKWAVDHCAAFVPDHLPPALRARARLIPLPDAIAQMHYPDTEAELDAARRRLAFDELFLIQLGMLTRRANWRDGPPAPALPVPESLIFFEPEPSASAEPTTAPSTPLGGGLWPLTASCFETSLPFRFTGAQRRATREVLRDMATTKPMSRLLQGDVGSGKTVVAAAALLAGAANGYQGALLAPTEILAEQHYRSLSALLAPFGLKAVLLTGSQRSKERTAALDALAGSEAAVAIGTHALIQEGVEYKALGLAIVDEQHRFGVEQRDALRQKGYNPHMLVMTATPIPRTLALTLYGDLDVSVLDEMPAGRLPVITRWRAGATRGEAYRVVEEEVAAGRQAYIICPLVEESDALEAKSAIKEYERLKVEVFPDLRLGLVHGQVKPAEKDRVMRAFRDGEIDVLVATAVVEVGVDVPNATVMLIEDADRFGLSQLHQFRGRVGRGAVQSYCYLLSQEASAVARERLSIMERTTDGFELAEADLALRGPGDFFGTRQSGLPELKVARLADTPLLAEARAQAEWLWSKDPYLRSLEHAPLRERVFTFWQGLMAH